VKRLCELKDELRLPVIQVGDSQTIRSWDSLRCPHAGSCDKSRPKCDGMTPTNLLTISRIEDSIFAKGYFHANDSPPVEMGVSWKHRPRKGD
jgi:hypothetical protein